MQKSNSYIKGLDGLRAIAATLVFAFHTWGHWGWPTIGLAVAGQQMDLTWIFHYGTEGVSIFFVLSGFLLSQPFWRAALGQGRPVNIWQFFKRRFMRIYPAYLVALVIFALWFDTNDSVGLRLVYFVSHLALVHNLFELTIFRDSSPLWSVATEFQMYLILPLIFILIGWYLRDKGRPWIAAAVLFVATGLVGVAFYIGAGNWFAAHPVDPNWIQANGEVLAHLPIIGMAYFASGIAFGYVYQWVQNQKRQGLALHPAAPELFAVGFIALIIALVMVSPNLAGVSVETWPRLALYYGALVAAVALGGQMIGVTRLLEWGPIRWVGMISYSFYLYHDFVLHLVFHRTPDLTLGPISDGTMKGLLAYGITLVVSALSYYLIEKRFHAPAPKVRQAPGPQPVPLPAQIPVRPRPTEQIE